MAIITISRGCFSHGKEIAQRVAHRLGYECVSREILIEASEFFNIPERTLLHSIHDAPTFLERIMHGREKYMSYIEAAIYEHFRKDNAVYHGHAGHLLLKGIPKVLRVRIIADMDARITMLMAEKKFTYHQAYEFIKRDDEERTNWTRYLYKQDISNPELYDMVINIDQLTLDDAVDHIVQTAGQESFKLTPEEMMKLSDLAIESRLRALLNGICQADVTAKNGWVNVKCKPRKVKKFEPVSPKFSGQLDESLRKGLAEQVARVAHTIPRVSGIDCYVEPSIFQ